MCLAKRCDRARQKTEHECCFEHEVFLASWLTGAELIVRSAQVETPGVQRANTSGSGRPRAVIRAVIWRALNRTSDPRENYNSAGAVSCRNPRLQVLLGLSARTPPACTWASTSKIRAVRSGSLQTSAIEVPAGCPFRAGTRPRSR